MQQPKTYLANLLSGCFAVAALTLAIGPAMAADAFPTKPIRIIVTSSAGGLLDLTTRLVAQKMGDKLGQPIVVENRPGAGGLVALRAVKVAAADGYTLLTSANTMAIQQVVSRDPGYELQKDFAGVGPMTRSPLMLLVSPEQPDKGLADFMARAKANPGKLTYASAGIGTSTHLGAAAFTQRAGLDLVHVPYQGNPAAWPDVISRRVEMIMEPYGSGAQMISTGKMKSLGVASPKRLEAVPNMPTFAEQGLPNFSIYSWFGMVAPIHTPKAIVRQLNEALRAALDSPDLKERFRSDGAEVMQMSPEEFDTFLKGETADITKLVSTIGLPKQ